MRTHIDADYFNVNLTTHECVALGGGETIADRNNPFSMEAKVEVYPYSAIDPSFSDVQGIMSGPLWDERVYRTACVAKFLTNMDLLLYVPQEVARFAFISGLRIAKDSIQTAVADSARVNLLSGFPENGVMLHFGQ